MRYYKVEYGYESDDFIPIDETELEKAIYAHLTGKKAVFRSGTVSGDRILAIREDWHRAMGWAPGWKMGPDDWSEINDRGVRKLYEGHVAHVKERVERLITTRQEHLIGKNVPIPELEAPVSQKAIPLRMGLDELGNSKAITPEFVAKVRANLEEQKLLDTSNRHYTRKHQELHCECFKPERWICKEHNEEYSDCKCTPKI